MEDRTLMITEKGRAYLNEFEKIERLLLEAGEEI
jgi:predicted transcriptional regulator